MTQQTRIIKRQVNRDGDYRRSKTEFLAERYPLTKPKCLGSDIKKRILEECEELGLTMIDAKENIVFVNTKSILHL